MDACQNPCEQNRARIIDLLYDNRLPATNGPPACAAPSSIRVSRILDRLTVPDKVTAARELSVGRASLYAVDTEKHI